MRFPFRPSGQCGRLNLHDLLLFGFQGFVHALDGLVGHLLDLGLHALLVVLVDGPVLLGLLEVVIGVAADVADGDLLLLGVLAGDLGQLLAALLSERRDRNA